MKVEVNSEENIIELNVLEKRLRKQRFVPQMYGKESTNKKESIDDHKNDIESDERRESNGNSEPIGSSFCDQIVETKPIRIDRHLKVDNKMVKPIVDRLPFPELVESDTPSDGRIKCGKCLFRTDSEADMILHSVNHNVIVVNEGQSRPKGRLAFKRLECPTCEQTFSKSLLQKHIYIHTSENAFKCEQCGQEFTSFQNMSFHMKKHKTNVESIVNCEVCWLSFTSKKRLQKHQLIHRKDRQKSHLCDICGLAFYDKESLKSHTFRIHLPKNARKFKCDFVGCRYSCLYQHQMLEHQKVHSDEKPWACDQCDYTAKSKWTFKKHYRKHTNERPFKCPHCDYASSLSSNLTRHLRIHTGSKPFKCPYCSYSCNNHENLRKHVLNTRKHKGLYLYNCTHCVFGTNVFIDLRRHIETTHNDIYTVEQIDAMISSIYHKHEDNTTLVPNPQSSAQQSDQNHTNRRLRKAMPSEGKSTSNDSNIQMIFIKPLTQQSDESIEMLLPNNSEEFDNNYESEKSKSINQLIISKSGTQSSSEVVIIDSDVLEAEEVCVTQRMASKHKQIIISISK